MSRSAALLLSLVVAGCPNRPIEAVSEVAPTLTTQPMSVTVDEGQTATFSAAAEGGEPLSYQWRQNGEDLPQATSPSFTTLPATRFDTGARFSVVVSNRAGQVTSDDAVLTVTPATAAPVITTQPQAQVVTAGQTATFRVVATGTAPLAFQWRRDGQPISGATSAVLETAVTTIGDSGGLFSVVVSNIAGSTVSNSATLTVTTAAVAPTITMAPADATVSVGQVATFSVVATGTAPLQYQWRRSGVAIPGGTTATLVTAPASLTDSGAKFSVVVANTAGTLTSAEATLTVQDTAVAPTIATAPVNVIVNAGEQATFSVTANGTQPLRYQWRRDGATIAGATGSTWTTPATVVQDTGSTFLVVVANSVGSVTSPSATLTVNPTVIAPVITLQPANVTVAEGQTATFSVTAAGTSPLSYQWLRGATPISGATGPAYTTPSTVSSDTGAGFSVNVSNTAGTVTSATATLVVIGSGTGGGSGGSGGGAGGGSTGGGGAGTGGASATTSTLVANPSTLPANGTTTAITFTLLDASGFPIAGAPVTLSASGTGNTLGASSGATTAAGVFATPLASTVAESKTVTATSGTVVKTATVTFTPGPASAARSTVSAAPSSVDADGTSTATVTITVRDANDNPLVGVAPVVTSTPSATLVQPGATSSSGQSTGTVASSTAGPRVLTVSVGGVTIGTANVSFVAVDLEWSRWTTPPLNPVAYTPTTDTVTDTATALVWQRVVPSASSTYADATLYCDRLTLAGSTDWRLPTLIELLSIVDYSLSNPAINRTAFPSTPSQTFWSSSRFAGNNGNGWVVAFPNGNSSPNDLLDVYRVRCVR